jgi:RNA polymerase sigma-70 factor (ECF subfamily)
MERPELDEALVAAASAGDEAALRGVYLALAPTVLVYLRSRGVSDPEAVTSEVFVAVLPRLPALRGGLSGLRALVFSVAHARMVDAYRAGARRPATVDYEPAEDTRVVPSAEDDALRALGNERVEAILALLPADQRDVLYLRVIADLSVEHVAQVIGRSQGAVKQLQRRALVTLRGLLAERRVTR